MKIITDKRSDEIMDSIPVGLTNDTTISADAKLLWVKLWNSNKSKKKDYKEWKPSINGLATQFGVERTTVLRWKKELDDSGWITTIGSRNATSIIVHLVANKQPVLVAKMQPYTITSTMASKPPIIPVTNILSPKEKIPTESGDIFNGDTSVTSTIIGLSKKY